MWDKKDDIARSGTDVVEHMHQSTTPATVGTTKGQHDCFGCDNRGDRQQRKVELFAPLKNLVQCMSQSQ